MNDADFKALTAKMIAGVITQGMPCVNEEGNCVYRNDQGLSCAVGQAIPEGKYLPEFDDEEYGIISISEALEWGLTFDQQDVLNEIQGAHDQASSYKDDFLGNFQMHLGRIEYLQPST